MYELMFDPDVISWWHLLFLFWGLVVVIVYLVCCWLSVLIWRKGNALEAAIAEQFSDGVSKY